MAPSGEYQGRSVSWIESNWGSLASVLGLAVAVVGLTYAIYQIRQTRSAATAAKEAALQARSALARNLTIADLTRASERMDELKRLHRSGQWQRAMDRYPDVRRLLVEILTRHQNLPTSQQRTIQTAIGRLRAMEETVEVALRDNSNPDLSQFNRTLSNVQAVLDQASSQLQHGPIGESSNG